MSIYIFQRVFYMVITILIIASATFFLMKMMPGTPLSLESKLTDEQRQIILEKYNLDDPVAIQYFKYMGNLIQGDLGVSFHYDNRKVTDLIIDRIGPSAHLGIQALFVGTIIGILLGIISALNHNSYLDYGATMIAILGKSIPNFIFAGLLQYWVGVKLGWFPVAFWKGFEYTILPTIALSMIVIATCARFLRTEMIEVLNQDYILTAKAKGISNTKIVFIHGLRNALIPLVTILGPLAISLLTGTLVIEKVFAIPGLGEQFISSIQTNDYPIIMGTTLLYASIFVSTIFIIDLLYGIIDPRIRLSGGKEH